MSALPDPHYEARVSPALARLRTVRFAGARSTGPRRITSQPVAEDGPWPDVPDNGFTRVLLRRDGRRPLAVNALLVIEARSVHQAPGNPRASLTRSVRLFVGSDGQLVAHIHLDPGPDCPARPVSRAGRPRTPDEFEALSLETVDVFSSTAGPDNLSDITDMSRSLRASAPSFFAGLSKPATASQKRTLQ